MNASVGHAQALSMVDDRLGATLRGSGGCVIVDGPFGIGKTHLLKAAAAAGAERGLTVVAGRVNVTDQPIPIHLLINYLRHVSAGEVDFDDLTRPDRNPFWLMDRVGELVESAARRHPLVVVLDDAQRIDDVSALALRGLVQSLSHAPVLWLLARRPVATPSLAQHAVDWLIEHAAARLHLRALDDEAVAAFCAGILGARPDASVLGWAARCGGNPWLMENVFSALIKAGQMIIADGAASVVAERLPDGVLGVVRNLLDELPPAVRRLLVQGRRLGGGFAVEEAATLLGGPAAEFSATVDEAARLGLLRRDGTGLTFTHRIVGDALQHAVFRGGEPAPAVPALGAGDPQSRSARPEDAPARPLWPGPAPLDVTAAATPPAPPPGCSCDEIAARATAHLEDSVDEAPRTLARALRLLAGAGRGTEACRLADVVMSPGVEASAEAHLVLELGQGLRDAGDHGMAAGLLRRTLGRPEICELDRAKLSRLAADAARGMGDGPGAEVARPPARQYCADGCAEPLWTWLVRALVATDGFEEAAAVLSSVEQEAEKLGAPLSPCLWHGHRAELLAAAGRLDEAGAEAENALRLVERSAPEDSVPARLVLARISIHRGDLATASDQLRTTERLMAGTATAHRARLAWALAQFHAAGGRPAMMVRTLINTEGRVEPDPLLFTEAPTAAATLVRHARQAGLGAEAERAAEYARRIAQRNPLVQSLAGGAAHADGVLRNNPAALHRAADLHRLAGRPLPAASALEDAARAELGIREKARAARLLASATDLYLECGAQSDLDRARRKLRRLDAPLVRRLGAERPKSGWESLTSAELRVIRAIVDGRTNREAASALFLSPHTVDSHLRRVFSKLEINSRVELTKHFVAHEAFPPVLTGAHQPASAG
jgi:DNA-binding CsgD family transcriptional regulator